MKYQTHIENILNGSPINVEAKAAGVNMNTLRRVLILHPDYEAAKAAGKLHQKGITPKLAEAAKDSPAVAEVMAGATLQETAKKHGIPPASLTKMVHIAHPGVNLSMRGATREELAAAALKKAKKALNKAKQLQTA